MAERSDGPERQSDESRLEEWLKKESPDWIREKGPDGEPPAYEKVVEFRYDPTQPRAPKGSSEGGRWISGRAARAITSHKPMTREKHLKAAKFEAEVAAAIDGDLIPGNAPFDIVTRDRHVVEVKTIIEGVNPKITMHPDSLARKQRFMIREKVRGHTVAIDVRGPAPKYYYRSGVGSFRLSAMKEVAKEQLKELLS